MEVLEVKESILTEVNSAIEELKAGKYEEVYVRLTNLSDDLTTDIIAEKANELDTVEKDI